MIRGWPARGARELCLQRAALALLVYAGYTSLPQYSGQPYPVGIAKWIDFSALADPSRGPWLQALLLGALALYVAGRAMPLAVAVMALLYTGAGALAYSQGMLEHRTQLLALVLLGQLVAYLQSGWPARRRAPDPEARWRAHDLAARYSVEVIAAGYVLSGLMKVVLSHGQWLAQVPMIATDIVKSFGQAYCTTGDAALLARGDATAAFVLAHPDLMRMALAPGPLLELAAAGAVLGRRSAFVVGLGLVVMHRGIEALMQLTFAENEGLLLIYFVNVPFLLIAAARWWPTRNAGRAVLPA